MDSILYLSAAFVVQKNCILLFEKIDTGDTVLKRLIFVNIIFITLPMQLIDKIGKQNYFSLCVPKYDDLTSIFFL